MQLKFKPGEETSVIEGLQAEVPGRTPSPSLRSPRPWPIGQFNPAAQGLDSPSTSQPAHLKEDKLNHPRRAILAAERPWAGYLGRRETLGGLFWPRKTLGGLFWLRKHLGGRYLGCGKQCARAHSGNLTYRLCILIHRKPSEEQFCEARIPQWVGPQTWNREAAGSIPGSPKVISG